MGDLKSGLQAWRALVKGNAPADSPAKANNTQILVRPKQAPPHQVLVVRPRHGDEAKQTGREGNAGIEVRLPVTHSVAGSAPLAKPSPDAQPGLTARPEVVPREFKVNRRSSLRRQDNFKVPDPWVAGGVETRTSTGRTSGSLDIVIGLDFGTSYTKAAVGLLDKIFPVTWEGVSKFDPAFLLPSEYSLQIDASPCLGQRPGASVADLRADLKIPFINPAVSIRSIATASIFLALVLRYIRAWVYHFHGDKLGSASIRWQLNVGAPSNGLEDGHLQIAYKRLACTAWILSENPGELSASIAEEAAGAWQPNELPASLTDVSICPEFVAQLAGYVQSPQRQPGLHALVDVGGGTMDVVTFNVHMIDHEDTFPFLVPEVRPLGTQGLSQNRLVGLPIDTQRDLPDELAPVPSPAHFSQETGVELDHVVRRDKVFREEVGKVLRTVFETTKSRRYRLAPAWVAGVRTFFTGGGAQADLYRDAILGVRIPSPKGLQLMQLPTHPKLDGFAGSIDDYQRVSVACGLAQDAFSLGRIVPARLVDDDKPVLYEKRERPDRDDLYPH